LLDDYFISPAEMSKLMFENFNHYTNTLIMLNNLNNLNNLKKYEEKIEQNVKISNKKKLTKIDCTNIDDLNEKFIINEYESIETKNTYESTEYENITLM
jgi:hypothetical protein